MTKIGSNLQIDSARLWGTIHETAKFGATPKGGVRRLTLGPEDKQVRDWFRNACEAAGLDARGFQRVGYPGAEATPERLAHDLRLGAGTAVIVEAAQALAGRAAGR